MSLGVFFWYSTYKGYFDEEISSVKLVEPWNNRVRHAGATTHQPSHWPQPAAANTHWDHQNACSAKKLGCLEYFHSPVVKKPFFFSAAVSFLECFLLWKIHCCWSAIASMIKKPDARMIPTISKVLKLATCPLSCPNFQEAYIGASRLASNKFWMNAMNTKWNTKKTIGFMLFFTIGQR